MKSFISILLFCMFLSQNALAEMPDKDCHKGRLLEQLQLDDNQVDAVRQIMMEKREKRKAIMESVRPQMEALHFETKEQLATVLTDEQLLKFDEIEDKRFRKREDWRTRRFGY